MKKFAILTGLLLCLVGLSANKCEVNYGDTSNGNQPQEEPAAPSE